MNERHHPSQSRRVWPPVDGLFFRYSLVRGGWKVPATIRFDDRGWVAVIDGEECIPHPDPALAEGVADVWHHGTLIDQQTYDWLLAVKAWAAANHPGHPCLNPLKPMLPRMLTPHYAPTTTEDNT